MIEFGGAGKTYRSVVPPRTTEALRDLTLTVHRGEVVGVAGPNGAGKTTMLGLLLGFLRPTGGRVTVDGMAARDYVERHGAVYVPEIVSMPAWWTVTGALRRLAVLAGVPAAERPGRVESVIGMLGLAEHRAKRVKQLSKGNVQRLGIAQAMLQPADLVVFDEPTHGLDPVWTQRFRGIVDGLRSEHRAIVIASHNLDELERLADRVAILDRGRLTQIAESHHAPSSEYAQYVLVLGAEHPGLSEAFPGAERVENRRDVAYHVLGTLPELNERLARLLMDGARVRAFFPARSRLEAAFREAVGEERP